MIAEEGPWDAEWVERRLRLVPLARRVHAELLPDAPRFDWNPTVARLPTPGDSLEAELKIAHVVHSPSAFCSASSTV